MRIGNWQITFENVLGKNKEKKETWIYLYYRKMKIVEQLEEGEKRIEKRPPIHIDNDRTKEKKRKEKKRKEKKRKERRKGKETGQEKTNIQAR